MQSLPASVTNMIDAIRTIPRMTSGVSSRHPTSPDLSMAAALLHTFLDFPLMNGEDCMEEVLQDTTWLDKKWAEKDRLLHHFSRHNTSPADSTASQTTGNHPNHLLYRTP